ncbi:MAG TPA: glycoside hydrolase family 15 protein [Streptosporangiaceae bacterium]|jgi:glucoamylase|nr:glycoside hydrolase family 15 protein [Streptosporangiaceae bacterium]
MRTSPTGHNPRSRRGIALLAAAVTTVALGLLGPAQGALAQYSPTTGSAPGAPGANATWNESNLQAFADSLGSASKVSYTLGDGELENAFYPEMDTPSTFGLQYIVTDGSTFGDTEVSSTTHAISLVDPTSLVWQQVNTATNGDFKITKTYVADPSRSVVLIQTTFANLSSKPLQLYADYLPQLNNDGMGNTGGTDATSGDLESENGSVASALRSSAGFSQTTTGYAGTSSDGSEQLTSGYKLTSTYTSASTAGHIVQVAQIPVASSGATTFTLALGFDSTESAAISDAATSLSTGFSALESSFESGWHSWVGGLSAPPASVTGNAQLKQQYYVSLMEVKADEDKTYTGAFVAAPTDPWGTSTSANSPGDHGYHAVWTRDEYEMASALLAAGDSTDANAALQYIFNYEEESSGAVKQNTFLNGTAVFGSLQMDEVADPIILAYQLGATNSADWSHIESLANYLVANGPYTPEERWEEIGGYSPSTMAAEIAGLVCAASIAMTNGATGLAATYQDTALSWASQVDNLTYTTTGPYGSGDYFLRVTQDGNPNSGADISLANGGGTHDDRTVVDAGFLELVRLGVKAATAADITSSLPVVDSQLAVQTPEGPVYHRYNFDGYGETASGGDYTGTGVGNPWPVLTGERGEYDVADGNLTGAQSMLAAMAGAANSGYQIPEQVWGGSTGTGGFTFGQPDNSSTPLMWAMAQYARLAIDISAGQDTDTPAVVTKCVQQSKCPVSGPVKETVNVTVPVNTDASADTVYLDGNLSALGFGQSDWASNGIAMTRVSADKWTATVYAAASTPLSYKYDLGSNWSNAEETADCGSVGDRSMTVNGGTVSDTVANWEGPGACGDSGAVINVTVPSGTPSGDTVYLSGGYNVLGTGIPTSDNWLASAYPMIKTGADTWTLTITGVPAADFQYKFELGNWNNVEETSSCGNVSNRTFDFNDPDQTYTANDTVAGWEGIGGC